MCGSWPPADHPGLTPNTCILTSPVDFTYNCIAWAAGDSSRWWWPVPLRGINYWPPGIPREETVAAFVAAFGTRGYSPCAGGSVDPLAEKVAIFAKSMGGLIVPTHAALQLPTGLWTSKMGPLEDIYHFQVQSVAGPRYGQVVQFLSRPRHAVGALVPHP